MNHREIKLRARMLMFSVRPMPILIYLTVYIFDSIASLLAQCIGDQPILFDLDALSNMDYANIIRIDFANTEFIPMALLTALQILVILISYGFTYYCLQAVRQEKVGFGNLLDAFSFTLRALVLTICKYFLIGIGLALFVVPGVLLILCYAMSDFIMFDHPEWSAFRCMKESRRVMKGHKKELFKLLLSFIWWLLLSLIPGVSVFVKPYMSLAKAGFYNQICAANVSDDRQSSDTPDEF